MTPETAYLIFLTITALVFCGLVASGAAVWLEFDRHRNNNEDEP